MSSSRDDASFGFRQGLWTVVDVLAVLGAVGGALAVLLGVGAPSILVLPIILPILSLVAAFNREGLIAEASRRQLSRLSKDLFQAESQVLKSAKVAIDEVREEMQAQSAGAKKLSSIETRLSSLEGSMLSAGRSMREAASAVSVVPERLQREHATQYEAILSAVQREQMAQYDAIVAAVQRELKRAGDQWNSQETAALAKLDTRLAAVEGSLSGLEVAQGENIRRLSMSLNSALADAESTLQASIRNEVSMSMDPVRRLPQLLAAALPMLSSGEGTAAASVASVPAQPPLDMNYISQQMGEVVRAEVDAALARALESQNGMLPLPTPMDEEQWAALGARMAHSEKMLEGLLTATEESALQRVSYEAERVALASEPSLTRLDEESIELLREKVRVVVCKEVDGMKDQLPSAMAASMRNELSGIILPVQDSISQLSSAMTQRWSSASNAAREAGDQSSSNDTAELSREAAMNVAAMQIMVSSFNLKLEAVAAVITSSSQSVLEAAETAVAAAAAATSTSNNTLEGMSAAIASSSQLAVAAATEAAVAAVQAAQSDAAISEAVQAAVTKAATEAAVAAVQAAQSDSATPEAVQAAVTKAATEAAVAAVQTARSDATTPEAVQAAVTKAATEAAVAAVQAAQSEAATPQAVQAAVTKAATEAAVAAVQAAKIKEEAEASDDVAEKRQSAVELKESVAALVTLVESLTTQVSVMGEQQTQLQFQLQEAREAAEASAIAAAEAQAQAAMALAVAAPAPTTSTTSTAASSGGEVRWVLASAPSGGDVDKTAQGNSSPALQPLDTKKDGPSEDASTSWKLAPSQPQVSKMDEPLGDASTSWKPAPSQPQDTKKDGPSEDASASWKPASPEELQPRSSSSQWQPQPVESVGPNSTWSPPSEPAGPSFTWSPQDPATQSVGNQNTESAAGSNWQPQAMDYPTSASAMDYPTPAWAQSAEESGQQQAGDSTPPAWAAEQQEQFPTPAWAQSADESSQQQAGESTPPAWAAEQQEQFPTPAWAQSAEESSQQQVGDNTPPAWAAGQQAAQQEEQFPTASSSQQYPSVTEEEYPTPPWAAEQQQQQQFQSPSSPRQYPSSPQQYPGSSSEGDTPPTRSMPQPAAAAAGGAAGEGAAGVGEAAAERSNKEREQEKASTSVQGGEQPKLVGQQNAQEKKKQPKPLVNASVGAATGTSAAELANQQAPRQSTHEASSSAEEATEDQAKPPIEAKPTSEPQPSAKAKPPSKVMPAAEAKPTGDDRTNDLVTKANEGVAPSYIGNSPSVARGASEPLQGSSETRPTQTRPEEAAATSSVPPAADEQYTTFRESEELCDLEGLSEQAILAEGLRLLRMGREEVANGEDLGLADRLLQLALVAFQRAVEMAPEDARALGNLGNGLLAQGELKKLYLEVLQSGPGPSAPEEIEVQRAAEVALQVEASSMLTKSGEMFKRVLEVEGWSSRALVNWGRAMCMRAELADSSDLAAQLFGSALDKFEAVLEEEPDMTTAKYRAALAMVGLARCRPDRTREAFVLLNDAANYLQEVIINPEASSLAPGARDLLVQCDVMLQDVQMSLSTGGPRPVSLWG